MSRRLLQYQKRHQTPANVELLTLDIVRQHNHKNLGSAKELTGITDEGKAVFKPRPASLPIKAEKAACLADSITANKGERRRRSDARGLSK